MNMLCEDEVNQEDSEQNEVDGIKKGSQKSTHQISGSFHSDRISHLA